MTFKDGDRVCREEDGRFPGTIRGLKRPHIYNVELDIGGWSEAHEDTIFPLNDENRVIKITNCRDCPAFHTPENMYDYCSFMETHVAIEPCAYRDTPPPDWCPLRRGKITIEIKK
jgi:hypothetical protein